MVDDIKNISGNWDDIYISDNRVENELISERKYPISKTKWFEIVKDALIDKYGSLSSLNCIELGSGTGKFSLSFAKFGVETTLVDSSKESLHLAKKIFEKNLSDEQMEKVHFIKGDIINLPKSLFDQFDFSISSGVAEHFLGESRTDVIINHINVLKNGGLTFIAVPHTHSPHYWIHRKMCEVKGIWPIEEWPFTKNELKSIVKKNNYKIIHMYGQNIVGELVWLFPPSALIRKITGFESERLQQFDDDALYFFKRRGTIFGNIIGYSCTMVAEKTLSNTKTMKR